MELMAAVQTYDWGKPAKDSIVADLYQASGGSVTSDGPYAELWMGTHPSGPSIAKCSGETLKNIIEHDPTVLGNKSRQQFGKDLPFILKVLSIRKALSIQAHPAKRHAEQLHKDKPELYKDPNHKPELAIALTPFNALCGFRPVEQIKIFLAEVQELKDLIGAKIADQLITSSHCDNESRLKDCFGALMKSSEAQVKHQLRKMLNRLEDGSAICCDTKVVELIKTLNSQFPDDVGCFVPFFLNILELEPGQAIFLGPNEPHAYISGDCVECMACSDNVVRAGLTPKFKDVSTLVDMLNYHGAPPEAKLFQPIFEDCNCELFSPPVPDFSVAKINVPIKYSYSLPVRGVASIFIVISGRAKFNNFTLGKGSVVFLPADGEFILTEIIEEIEIYQAMANV